MLPKTNQEFELRFKRRQKEKDDCVHHMAKQLDDSNNRKLFVWGFHKDAGLEKE